MIDCRDSWHHVRLGFLRWSEKSICQSVRKAEKVLDSRVGERNKGEKRYSPETTWWVYTCMAMMSGESFQTLWHPAVSPSTGWLDRSMCQAPSTLPSSNALTPKGCRVRLGSPPIYIKISNSSSRQTYKIKRRSPILNSSHLAVHSGIFQKAEDVRGCAFCGEGHTGASEVRCISHR